VKIVLAPLDADVAFVVVDANQLQTIRVTVSTNFFMM